MDVSLEKSLDELADTINATIAKFETGDPAQAKQKKSTADWILGELLKSNLAYKETFENKRVGSHGQNRYGAGIDAIECHTLLLDILKNGWSWPEVVRATAFEVNPSKLDEQWKFQDDLAKMSDGFLPTTEKQDLKILAVMCAHTVFGLKATQQKCKTMHDEIATDGFLSLDKILARAPSYEAPLQKGMEWCVVRHQVETKCPELALFLQDAGNSGNINRGKTKLQLHWGSPIKTEGGSVRGVGC